MLDRRACSSSASCSTRCKPKHPLIDLHLFRNRNLTIASITMFVFVDRVLGRRLLFPSYFLQVRGETTLHAGLLMAPQGIGAMLTMPIAGTLTDKIAGRARSCRSRIVLIVVGHVRASPRSTPTRRTCCCSASLFVMGLGMGVHDDADHDRRRCRR